MPADPAHRAAGDPTPPSLLGAMTRRRRPAPLEPEASTEAGALEGRDPAVARRRRRLRNWLLAAGVLTVLVTSGAVLIVLALMQEHPPWWRTVVADDPETKRTAEQVENGILNAASSPRPMDVSTGLSEPWGMSIAPDQANAWLNTRMREWITSQEGAREWFDLVRELQVDFSDNLIVVGVKVRRGGREKVFSATLVPSVDESGQLWMLARWVHLGRLTVPASWVLPDGLSMPEGETVVVAAEGLTGVDDATAVDPGEGDIDLAHLPEARQMFAAFSGAQPVLLDPSLKLPDGRRVRLLGLRTLTDQRLLITCRTEAARSGGSADGVASSEDGS